MRRREIRKKQYSHTLDRVTNTPSNGARNTQNQGRPDGLSWKAMLAILALAILVAAAIAYLLVNPFFHQPAHSTLRTRSQTSHSLRPSRASITKWESRPLSDTPAHNPCIAARQRPWQPNPSGMPDDTISIQQFRCNNGLIHHSDSLSLRASGIHYDRSCSCDSSLPW